MRWPFDTSGISLNPSLGPALTSLLVISFFVPATMTGADRPSQSVRDVVRRFCVDCHSEHEPGGSLDLSGRMDGPIRDNRSEWEKVVRKLQARQMPPLGESRPTEKEYTRVLGDLVRSLDAIAENEPQPGRTDTFRRLTRIEYQNAIRDLFGLEIDASELLPPDELSHGFDTVTVGELSPTLLSRYVKAAQAISRLVLGGKGTVGTDSRTVRIRPDITQEGHVVGLPFGTRGGALIRHWFPRAGKYEIRVRLARDRNEEVEGLSRPHELDILLDDTRARRFVVKPPGESAHGHSRVDVHLVANVEIADPGVHRLGVTFVRDSGALLETKRQPYQSRFNYHRHPRTSPAVFQVSIVGPLAGGRDPSRQKTDVAAAAASFRPALSEWAARAWRRPLDDSDLDTLMELFRAGAADQDVTSGAELALAGVLVNPRFLFRIERDPPKLPSGAVYRVSDFELASRLSFFLWSSLPDKRLMELAARDILHEPDVLESEVHRLIRDPRSESLATNFAAQWLYLRNLDSAHPDMRRYPDFDHNLRYAMRRETELLFRRLLRDDLSVLDLISSNETYLNERLAKHYGIPHVHGSRFRPVQLDGESHRGGLLRHASVLTVTSYATRTSPVLRGRWVLENLMGTPPPPPPDDVPALKENSLSADLTMRERLAQHRSDPNCRACHQLMDPIGFSLENFDAVGRWRELESGHAIDDRGGLPDGSEFRGVAGLEKALLARPELFVRTLTDKLLTFALGRGIEPSDAAAVRKIVRNAQQRGYRFSAIVQGIVASPTFQMRTVE